MGPIEKATFLKYCDLPLPRHTSFPAANFWTNTPRGADHASWLAADLQEMAGPPAVGLYVHIPFCRSLCSYCGCTREVIPDELRAASDPSRGYIESIKRERELWDQHLSSYSSLSIDKIHLGGGTPTFLSPDQLHQLWDALGVGKSRTLKGDAELAAEVDPRVTTAEHFRALWDLGFRRISLGVQDFDAIVQGKINRIQSFDLVKKSVELARKVGFKQINFDLIYGLPGQTTETILKTLELAISLSPTRVAFYRLAVMPEIFKWQKTFRAEDLPDGSQTLEFMLLALQYFQSTNYQFIGFDHFASPEDPLSRDYHSHKLVRNFQGMTTGSSPITIGLGPSAISSGPSYYAQNPHKTSLWVQGLTDGLATQRGHRLTPQDKTRRLLLQELYCYGTLSDLSSLHTKELASLATLTDEGLLATTPSGFKVTLLGQLLTRVIGSALDPYLPEGAWRTGLSAGKNSAAG